MHKYILDIEADNLLDKIQNVWCIVLRNIETNEIFTYLSNDLSWQQKLNEECAIIGHNIIGYDLIALRKIYGWQPSDKVKVYDTLLLSQVLDYNRFNGRHSLKHWGEFLGVPKSEFDDFSKFTQEMLDYCIQDTLVNKQVYNYLLKELNNQIQKKPLLKASIKNEHVAAQFCADAEYHGWLFDKKKAIQLLKEISSKMKVIEDTINPHLRLEVKPKDKEPKEAKWNKNGNYDANTAKYFDVKPEDGKLEIPPIQGPFSRIEFVQPDIGNLDSVKLYLKTLGWKADDWNWKKVGNQFIKVSEKLTTSSLEPLGEIGKMVDDYYTLRARHSIVSGWLEALDKNNRLHGNVFLLGTPTGRARHSGIVNVPSVDAIYGPEIRSLFIVDKDWDIIGADSSGNQMRGLLHYLKNDEYTDLVINGDVHSKNAEILSKVVGEEVPRKKAKSLLYAFLFGAGSEKAALTVVGKRDKKIGSKILDAFTQATPGLKQLVNKISSIYDKTAYNGAAWIPCIDGRKIYTDSPHKSLNYLLQSMEAVTCKSAITYATEKLKAENIPYIPLIFMHDEIQIQVPTIYSKRSAEICKEAFKEGPKNFGVTIMDGESKIGKNWYETH